MVETCLKKLFFIFMIFFVLSVTSSPAMVSTAQPVSRGFVMVLRGGIGAMAVIDTYYVGDCFEDCPVQYTLTIEGDGVFLPGTRMGTVPGMGRTFIHTGLAFGFGPVQLKCSVYNGGKLIEERTKPGLMIGLFVIA